VAKDGRVKVLDVNEFYAEQGGGVKTYTNEKLRQAARLGHQMVVVAPGPEDREEERFGGRVVWVKGPPMPFDPRYFVMYRERAIHDVIRRERPDVIEGSSLWAAGWIAGRYRGNALKALIMHQDPVAVFSHTLLDRWVRAETIDAACYPFWEYVRRLSSRFDATVVAGEWLSERLSGFGVEGASAVPFGIDRHLFSPEKRDSALRRELLGQCGLPETGQLLVTISRHHPEKRLGFLLQAMSRLRTPNVGLVLYGDGPLRNRVRAQAAQVPGVHVAGFVDDRAYLARAIASADALLHGSAAETFGFVVAEALCSGTPVVAPNRGGAFDFLSPEYAESYRPGDLRDCVAAIERLLARGRRELSLAAVRASETRVHEPAQHFSGLFDLYSRLLEARR
jgi:alpha-1,6-mannosyltransferase